jgi:cytoskeletal protein CcmA (bactofilin family)
MFNNSKKISDNIKIDTIIGPSSTIEGKISATGTVRIDGTYTGDIFSDADVIVGENGVINGNIHANNISVSGKVDGNVMCRGLLEILPTGRLDGDIEVNKISICDGAIFKGKCNMAAEMQNA